MPNKIDELARRMALPQEFEAASRRYPEIYAIVAPPRCSSTALARVFWEHPSIGYYCHEPFEIAYFRDAPLAEVAAKLGEPLDLGTLKSRGPVPGAASLVVKEMPYQVGECFDLLSVLATAPIVFLIRDPRLNIASRMEKKVEVGDSPLFPLVETGWELLEGQVNHCLRHDIPHLIVSAADFRDRPLEIFPQVFSRLGLSFTPRMLAWRACADLEIDNLEGDHSHLYTAVLSSTGLSPEVEEPPPLEWFPTEAGFRDHVGRCLEIYRALLAAPARVRLSSEIETGSGGGARTD